MRVLLLAENWPPRQGGIENYLTHVARELSYAGHKVRVVVPKTKNAKFEIGEIRNPVESLRDHGVKPRGGHAAIRGAGKSEKSETGEAGGRVEVVRKRFFWPLVRPAWLPLFVWLWRQAKRERWDVTLCGKGLFEGLAAYYLNKHLGIPYAVFTYGMEIEEWARRDTLRRKLLRVMGAAIRVFVINDETKARLGTLGVSGKKLVKLWPGVDERFLRAVPDEDLAAVLKKYKLRQPYVLSVGRLIERKGFTTLIKAFGQLDQAQFGDVQLVIVGDGPQLSELDKLADDEWIATSVHFLTDVPDEELAALYAGAQIFALTPLQVEGDLEGFGIVYLEAAAQGVPALATRSGGADEAVVDNETGLVAAPGSVKEIGAALAQLLSDRELTERLGAAARDRVVNDFAWTTRSRPLLTMIDQIESAQ